MTTSSPAVTVIRLFTLLPGKERSWWDTWHAAGQRAIQMAPLGCHAFYLTHNACEPARYAVVSEWESREAFNAYVRTAGPFWLSRAFESIARPDGFLCLEHMTAAPTPEAAAERVVKDERGTPSLHGGSA